MNLLLVHKKYLLQFAEKIAELEAAGASPKMMLLEN